MTPPNKQKTELLVGIFVFFGLALLGGLVLKFGDFRYGLRSKYTLSVIYRDAGNLTAGAPVRRGGVEIGRVSKDPVLVNGLTGVSVQLLIFQEYLIAKDSAFSVKTDGIIGDAFIEVTPPLQPTGEMIAGGDTVEGTSGADIGATATRVADKSLLVLEDIRGSLVDLKGAIGKISTGVLGDENLANLGSSLKSLNESLHKFDEQVLSTENTEALNGTLKSLHQSSDKLSGSLDQISATISSVDDMIKRKLGPGLDEFGRAATTIRKAADGLGIVASDMHSGQGMISGLLRDPKMREDFSSLISNLRRHGIFWYKDDAAKEKDAPPNSNPRKSFFKR